VTRNAIDRVLGDFDFDLLTEEERIEFLRLMDASVPNRWTLTPKQQYADAVWRHVDWLLYGGAAGGGKSDFACHHVNELSNRIPNHNSLLIRQSIPELRRSLILRLITRIKQYKIPARYRKRDGQSGFDYQNGSLIECGHCATDEDVGKYLSAEYDCMVIDEASQLTPDQIVQLSARLRTTKDKAALGARPHLGLFTNPGDVAHAWLYDTFVTACGYGQKIVVYDVSQGLEKLFPVREYEAPVSVRDATYDELYDVLIPWANGLHVEVDPATQLAVAFVPAKATDNPHIDPSYLKFLNALPERRRRQLRDGDWDTFEGQFFEAYSRATHVIEPFEIPESWGRIRGLDYGSTAPYCCLWGAWDNDGNCYVYREEYEAGLTPDTQARKVVARSVDGNQRREKFQATVADPSVFSDRRGTGQSIADMWRANGLHVVRAKNQRVAGWANVRQYLWDPEKINKAEGTVGGPRLYIFNTCTNLARTLPLMQHSRHNPEDLDTHLEDHAVDALRYMLAVRPMNEVHRRRIPAVGADAKWQQMLRRMDKRKGRPSWS
jgi:hypothetical protein